MLFSIVIDGSEAATSQLQDYTGDKNSGYQLAQPEAMSDVVKRSMLIERWRRGADAGDPESQYNLGLAYYSGDIVQRSELEG